MRFALVLQVLLIYSAYAVTSPLASTNDYFYTVLGAPNNIEGRLMDKDNPYAAVRSEDIAYIAESINERYALVTGMTAQTNRTCDVYLLSRQGDIAASILNECEFLDPEYQIPNSIVRLKPDFAVTNFYNHTITTGIIVAVTKEIKQTMEDGTEDIYTSIQYKQEKDEARFVETNISFGVSSLYLAQLYNAVAQNHQIFSSTGRTARMNFSDLRFEGRTIEAKRVADKLYRINDAYRYMNSGPGLHVPEGVQYSSKDKGYRKYPDRYNALGNGNWQYAIERYEEGEEVDEEWVNYFTTGDSHSLCYFFNARFDSSRQKTALDFYGEKSDGTFARIAGAPVVTEYIYSSYLGYSAPSGSYIYFPIGSTNVLRKGDSHMDERIEDIHIFGIFDVSYTHTPDMIGTNKTYLVPFNKYLEKVRVQNEPVNRVAYQVSLGDSRTILKNIASLEGFVLEREECEEPASPVIPNYSQEDLSKMYQGESIIRVEVPSGYHYHSAAMTCQGFFGLVDLKPKTLIEE